jgi:hypothetical protein
VSARRIDVHHHYLTDDLLDELGRLGIHHVGGQPLGPSRFEDSIRVMDRHEIDAALLSVPIPLTFEDAATSRRVARALNESGARAVPANPGRLAGVTSTLAGLERHRGFDDDDRRAIETDNARRLFPRVTEAVGLSTDG